ncbi:MAG: bifunctional DNA-formamidopyrimidine glycosylase/DNA-(apurinic or apyrimidinic site) lyase [Rickettsiales bacterium]
MPELPEVETVRRGLEKSLIGSKIEEVILRRNNLRSEFPGDFALSLKGQKIKSISRRAKYLLFSFEKSELLVDINLIAHLGMSGRFSIIKTNESVEFQKHDHVIFLLDNGYSLVYNDPRRFGLMTICDTGSIDRHKLLSHLAPEPLGNGFNEEYLKEQLKRHSAAIKPVIMDQKVVVGVGNIYASESLFISGISPLRKANTITNDEISRLVQAIKQVLTAAIEAGGSTLKDFAHVSGEEGYFQHKFHVYGKDGKNCGECGAAIISIKQAGRATYYCANCQK